MLLADVVDQLHDDHGLADAGAAEEANLAALRVGRKQVDDLDPGLEHLRRRREVLDVRGVTVDRPALLRLDGRSEVDRLAEQVEDAPEGRLADRNGDRASGVDDLDAAREPVRRVHRDRPHAVVAEVLLDLADERLAVAAVDRDRVVDLRKRVREGGLDHDSLDLLDAAYVLRLSCGFHWAPCSSRAPRRRRRLP